MTFIWRTSIYIRGSICELSIVLPAKTNSLKLFNVLLRHRKYRGFKRRDMDASSSLHEALKSYQCQASERNDENCLKLVPEKVKNFFVSYMKQVQATNNMLYCLGNMFETNKSLLTSHSLPNRLNLLKANFKSDMERLTNDLISELGSSTPLNTSDNTDSSFLKYKFTSQPSKNDTSQFELFESSDEDTELGNMVDQIVTGKLCNSEKRKKTDNSDQKRCKIENVPSDELTESGPNKMHRNLKFDENGFLIVYVDGACSNNGRARAQAGCGVWFNYNHALNVAEPVKGLPTNNNAEIQAATKAILQAKSVGVRKIKIMSDSQFLINCMTQWIHKWKKNNWVTTHKEKVKNEESLKQLDSNLSLMEQVKWEYVEAHKGIEGNEQADALAKRGATMYRQKAS